MVADRLEALSVVVSSPDGNVEAEVKGRTARSLRFREGTYQRYTETALGHQLARLGTLLFVGRDRRVQTIMEEAGLHRPRQPSEALNEAQRHYLAQLPEIYATGLGPRQLVRFEATGLMHWQCTIADGTLGYLPEQEFIAEAMAAAQELLRQHRFETAMLRNEFFGSDLLEEARDRMRRRTALHGR